MPPTSKRRKSPSTNKHSHRSARYSAKGTQKGAQNNTQHKVKQSRGLVRIIAGTHRGRRLPVLVHEGLRPTGDRVKETLFNWLMNNIAHSVCLDMFAGSGSLGIEALSRGASKVVFVESDKKVAQQISDNVLTLREQDKAEVINGSAFDNLSSEHVFDIVFIDPPFGQNMVAKSLEKLVNGGHLSPNAFIYIETGHNDDYAIDGNFSLLKEIKTSQVNARLFTIS